MKDEVGCGSERNRSDVALNRKKSIGSSWGTSALARDWFSIGMATLKGKALPALYLEYAN